MKAGSYLGLLRGNQGENRSEKEEIQSRVHVKHDSVFVSRLCFGIQTRGTACSACALRDTPAKDDDGLDVSGEKIVQLNGNMNEVGKIEGLSQGMRVEIKMLFKKYNLLNNDNVALVAGDWKSPSFCCYWFFVVAADRPFPSC